jgi:dolichol-phosphate mannosyltransferase
MTQALNKAAASRPAARPGLARGAVLSVIVPTFNERDNVTRMVELLEACLGGVDWEVIFVDDDSPDGTADAAREAARANPRVRCIQRIGRRGLSTACIEGMLASSAPYLAVIDGDLQHDETLLPEMLEVLGTGETDIVIGSRYVDGGGIGDWDGQRASMSRFATRLSRMVLKTELSDPMSGFFMIRREALTRAVRGLSGIGFKIMLDLFISSPEPLRFRELPYRFRTREAGESKLDSRAAWDYVMLLLDKLSGRVVPVRFIAFSIVGGFGVVVHLALLSALFKGAGAEFVVAQTVATVVAMTSNFFLNNLLTYRDKRLRGWGMLGGWLSFTLGCSIGALANVGIATYLHDMGLWWLAAAGAGIVIGAVWNYAVTSVYTWKKSAAG